VSKIVSCGVIAMMHLKVERVFKRVNLHLHNESVKNDTREAAPSPLSSVAPSPLPIRAVEDG